MRQIDNYLSNEYILSERWSPVCSFILFSIALNYIDINKIKILRNRGWT